MQINYKTKKLKKQLTDERKLIKAYGTLSKKLNQRLEQLAAADNLKIIGLLPPLRLHAYKGARKGEWSIDIKDNWRLIFKIDESQTSKLEGGSINLAAVTIIKITSIEDPH